MKNLPAIFAAAFCAMFCTTLPAVEQNNSTALPATKVRIVKEFLADKIPVLELNKVSVRGAFAALQKAWEKQHPDEAFPVKLADDEKSNEWLDQSFAEGGPATLKGVPFFQAMRIIARSVPSRVDYARGIFTWSHSDADDVVTVEMPLRKELLEALKVRADATAEEWKAALSRTGFVMDDWARVSTIPGKLIVKARPRSVFDLELFEAVLIETGVKLGPADFQ